LVDVVIIEVYGVEEIEYVKVVVIV